MRYREKKSVADVIAWLSSQGVTTSRESYQTFLRRVLNLLPDDKAKDLKVDLELLRAVRRRLKLPLAPSSGRALTVKAVRAFNARSRQRRVAPVKKPKPVRAPLARPSRKPVLEADQLPLAGMVSPPSEPPKMRGTPDSPQGYADWKIVNEIARKKVFKKDRQIMLNMQGTVLHLKTREEYTPERLMADFGLTANEAQSCFMTFTT